MPSAARILGQMRRYREEELDQMADEAMRANDYREFQATHVPLKRRGRRVHRIQKLSLITLAAQRKYLKRQVLQLVHWRVQTQPDDLTGCIQDLEFVQKYLSSRSTAMFHEKGDGCTTARS